MSEDQEPVGNVAEEAVKLIGALRDWARENGKDTAAAAAGAAAAFRDVNEHVATDGEDCAYCPICQAISALRRTSPEVRQHLSSAAASLRHAAAAAMSTDIEDSHRRDHSPVQKINLDDSSEENGW